jgi:NAD(P)H dehydrogenase (quinone)
MNVLIVHAHPETSSFNRALTNVALKTLTELGHDVRISDLYAMKWKATLDTQDFRERVSLERFEPSQEQEHAQACRSISPDVENEQHKVAWADLVIFQFPMWWFSMPAILKGWIDRVLSRGFAYSSGRKYDTGLLKGKKAMLSLTTGTASSLYEANGIDGDLHHILWPIHNGTLAYTGFTVLPPVASWMPAQSSRMERDTYLNIYADRLRNLDNVQPLFIHPREDYDERQQLKPEVVARSGIQWNPRAGQTFEQSAEAFAESRKES